MAVILERYLKDVEPLGFSQVLFGPGKWEWVIPFDSLFIVFLL